MESFYITINICRALKKLHPYHPGWKTISNLGENFGYGQANRRTQTHKHPDRYTGKQKTYRQTYSLSVCLPDVGYRKL